MATTITDVVNRCIARFPRVDTETQTELAADMFNWLRELCSEYPFWFLHIDPGNRFPANFPMDDATDYAALTHYKTDWLDRGWLHAVEGQERYILSCPNLVGQYDNDGANWSDCVAQKVNYVKEYDSRGQFREDLEVHMSSRSISRTSWNVQSRPRRVLFESGYDGSGNKVSWLRFNPVPDKDYAYAVSFTLDQPVSYGSPLTNSFFNWEKEVAIDRGMLFLAEYFNEARQIEYYHTKMFGGVSQGGKRITGHIDRMKRDTRKKTEQDAQTVGVFQGAGWAVGRTSVGYNPRPGTYYGREGFS